MNTPSSKPVSELRQAAFRRAVGIALLLCAIPFARAAAQEHDDDDHDHEHLHFSHPIVTESPTPDTKLRFDFQRTQTSGVEGMRENAFRIEGEYAFSHSLSLAVVAPFASRNFPAASSTSGFGNVEVSLKGASLAYGEHGLLIGGGLSADLPTGSDTKGIGSSHLLELEPFIDVGFKRDALELVSFATLAATFHRRPAEDQERSFSVDFSALYHIRPRLEGLLEVATDRALTGAESGSQQTFIAPGLKVYPFRNRQIMFGGSYEIGTGDASTTRAFLLSAFYHF
jgi:hypothetical protein